MTKNFKGGYKIVSLNGNDLASGDSFVVSGLYENLVNSYKKPILVTEIVIDGEKQQDSFAVVKQSDGGYTIDVYGYALTVTSEDSVTIAEVTHVDSIGGVSGDITLGTGLSITEGGELSAESGGKVYMHYVFIQANITDEGYTHFRFNYYSSDNTIHTKLSDILKKIKPSSNPGTYINAYGTLFNKGLIYALQIVSVGTMYIEIFDSFTVDYPAHKEITDAMVLSLTETVYEM